MTFEEKFKLLVDRKAQKRFPLVSEEFAHRPEDFKEGAKDPDVAKAIELNARIEIITEVIEWFSLAGRPQTDYWTERKAAAQEELDKILDGGEKI